MNMQQLHQQLSASVLGCETIQEQVEVLRRSLGNLNKKQQAALEIISIQAMFVQKELNQSSGALADAMSEALQKNAEKAKGAV